MSNKIKQNNFKIKTYDGFEDCDYWYTELYNKHEHMIEYAEKILYHFNNLDEVYFDCVLSYRDFLISKDQNYYKNFFTTVIQKFVKVYDDYSNLYIIDKIKIKICYYFYNKIVFDATINLKNLK